MSEGASDVESTDESNVHRRALERIRFERSMGLDFLPRVVFAPAAAAPVSTPNYAEHAPIAAKPARTLNAAGGTPAVRVGIGIQRPPADAASVAERWRLLEARAMGCVSCALHRGRTNVVFGTGNRAATLVFVGEGPGADEDAQGVPFVGKAGQLLNKIIGAMGLQRDEVYICNVVKCRPPENRAPLPDEVAACFSFLREQLDLLSPKVIVALGSPAAKTLLNTATGITNLRGRWHSYLGIPVMPTYHPAFVLRQYTEEVRGAVWADMKQVMEKLRG